MEGAEDVCIKHRPAVASVEAFDYAVLCRVALKTLKEKIHFMPLGFELLPLVFTMPQLQELYESILEVKFDRRNFASKMLKLGILTEVVSVRRMPAAESL